ncbi:MAG: DUF4276 family protein [Deltaproteobacteria bacterium]|nr:DUF4276 family protein [Deltaproteobacteria bacterium]
MGDPLYVAIFCEDVAHERFLDALVRRLATEASRTVTIHTASGRGGHGRVISELRAFQRLETKADVLVVGIDANCSGWNQARHEVDDAIDAARFPSRAIACPDPHVERWYLADPEGLKTALGARATRGRRKCERDLYKRRLGEALRVAGHTVTLGGAEFASEIVDAMDLYRAGKNEPSLRHFLDAVRQALKAPA